MDQEPLSLLKITSNAKFEIASRQVEDCHLHFRFLRNFHFFGKRLWKSAIRWLFMASVVAMATTILVFMLKTLNEGLTIRPPSLKSVCHFLKKLDHFQILANFSYVKNEPPGLSSWRKGLKYYSKISKGK